MVAKIGSSIDTTRRHLQRVAGEPRTGLPCDACGGASVSNSLAICPDCREAGVDVMEAYVEENADELLADAL